MWPFQGEEINPLVCPFGWGFKVQFGWRFKGKPGQARIGGVLRNSKAKVLLMFSNNFGVCDSTEAEVLAILESLWLFSRRYDGSLLIESDSSNAIAWVSNKKANPWKFQFHFNEIRELSTNMNVTFRHVFRSANSMADVLAKRGIYRLIPWVGALL